MASLTTSSVSCADSFPSRGSLWCSGNLKISVFASNHSVAREWQVFEHTCLSLWERCLRRRRRGCPLSRLRRQLPQRGSQVWCGATQKKTPEGVFFSIKLTQHPELSASRADGGPVRARRTSPRRAGRCDGPGPRTRSRCSRRNCCPAGPS